MIRGRSPWMVMFEGCPPSPNACTCTHSNSPLPKARGVETVPALMKGPLWSRWQQRARPPVFGKASPFFSPSYSSISSSFLSDLSLSLSPSARCHSVWQGPAQLIVKVAIQSGDRIKNQCASLSKAPRMAHFDVSRQIWNSYVVTLHFILPYFFPHVPTPTLFRFHLWSYTCTM